MVFHVLCGEFFTFHTIVGLLFALRIGGCLFFLLLSNLFCPQLHICFCIFAAVAPPIIFKGKSLTYVPLIKSFFYMSFYVNCRSFIFCGSINMFKRLNWTLDSDQYSQFLCAYLVLSLLLFLSIIIKIWCMLMRIHSVHGG